MGFLGHNPLVSTRPSVYSHPLKNITSLICYYVNLNYDAQRGARLAPLVEPAALALRIVSSSPVLGGEIT